ncbi:MAG TPA: peptidoglycan-binding protein [Gemmatimonadaceae bacterium]|nr:peptidoglycan-binding protein [Gemmatimonadaceae bacterium]
MKLTLAAVAAMMIIPGIAMAQQDTTTQTMQRDTGMMQSDTGMRGVTTDTSRGAVVPGQPGAQNMGLSQQQVRQLQSALDSAGCSVESTGQFGATTDSAVACFQQKESLTGNNLNDVLRKLNLGFTASDSLIPRSGMGADTSGHGNKK